MTIIAEIRTRLGMTRDELARAMDADVVTVARLECGELAPDVDQVRNLCVIFWCGAEELLGRRPDPREWRTSPFAIWFDNSTPYGTLILGLVAGKRRYPITEVARSGLMAQLEHLGPLQGEKEQRIWLRCDCLDNKIVLINASHLQNLATVHDDIEEMPDYQHPEVYRSLENIGEGNESPGELGRLRSRVIEEVGEEELLQSVMDAHVVYADGTDEWIPVDDESSADLFGLETAPCDILPGTFLHFPTEGSALSVLVNLDHVAVIEVPLQWYLRQIADEE